MNKETIRIAQQLVAFPGGSPLLEQLRRVTPVGVQLQELSVGQAQIQLSGRVQIGENPGPLERINALALSLSQLPITREQGVKVMKITREDGDDPAVTFSLEWALNPKVRLIPDPTAGAGIHRPGRALPPARAAGGAVMTNLNGTGSSWQNYLTRQRLLIGAPLLVGALIGAGLFAIAGLPHWLASGERTRRIAELKVQQQSLPLIEARAKQDEAKACGGPTTARSGGELGGGPRPDRDLPHPVESYSD